VGAAAAAACLAVAVGVGGAALGDRQVGPQSGPGASTGPTLAMKAMRAVVPDAPISAEIALFPAADGRTEVHMHCWYHSSKRSDDKWTFRLVAVPRSGGDEDEVTNWTASDGDDVVMTEFSKLAPQDIGKVEVRFEKKPVLVYEPS
jgi:hypothetical protein